MFAPLDSEINLPFKGKSRVVAWALKAANRKARDVARRREDNSNASFSQVIFHQHGTEYTV